jgi:hypothetical protein
MDGGFPAASEKNSRVRLGPELPSSLVLGAWKEQINPVASDVELIKAAHKLNRPNRNTLAAP